MSDSVGICIQVRKDQYRKLTAISGSQNIRWVRLEWLSQQNVQVRSQTDEYALDDAEWAGRQAARYIFDRMQNGRYEFTSV